MQVQVITLPRNPVSFLSPKQCRTNWPELVFASMLFAQESSRQE